MSAKWGKADVSDPVADVRVWVLGGGTLAPESIMIIWEV
jgi:hypothetical protein